jgi:uncharacterized protein (TIGR02118 family)
MAKLIATYQQPKDAAVFDDHYFNTHVRLAKALPGLRSYPAANLPFTSFR